MGTKYHDDGLEAISALPLGEGVPSLPSTYASIRSLFCNLCSGLWRRLQTAPYAGTQANRRRERASEMTLVPEAASECNVC